MRKGNEAAKAVEDEEEMLKGELAFLPERTCAVCYQDQNPTGGSEQDVLAASAGANTGIIGNASTDITNPYEAIPCGCIYCFVCLAQRIEAEEGEGWTCLRCGEVVKQCKPWDGDVLVSERKMGSSRAVSEEGRPGSRKSIAWADELVEDDEQEHKMERKMSFVDPMPVEEEDEGYQEGQDEG